MQGTSLAPYLISTLIGPLGGLAAIVFVLTLPMAVRERRSDIALGKPGVARSRRADRRVAIRRHT